MQILDELASLIQKLNKRDNAGKENMATNNDQSQLFIAIAFRDQSLYIYLVAIRPGNLQLSTLWS